MGCSIAELRNKEVICKLNGTRIGNVDDVELDINNGRLVSIIIYGKGKIMGVFGKSEDIVIPWSDIDVKGKYFSEVQNSSDLNCVEDKR